MRVLNEERPTEQRVFEQLTLRRGDASDVQPLAQHESLRNDQVLFVNRHDESSLFFPGLSPLANDLANRFVLDLNPLRISTDLESTWNLLDLGTNDDHSRSLCNSLVSIVTIS